MYPSHNDVKGEIGLYIEDDDCDNLRFKNVDDAILYISNNWMPPETTCVIYALTLDKNKKCDIVPLLGITKEEADLI